MATESRRAPLILLLVLISMMAAGVFFNYGVSALSANLIAEFGISDGTFGVLMTVTFITAGVSAAALGGLSDRLNARLLLGVITLGAAAVLIATIVWHNFVMFLLGAVVSGLTQSFSNPVTNRIIAHRVPTRQRASWMGWKQSGIQVGMLLSGLLFPVLMGLGGWTLTAGIAAAICVALFLLGWVVLGRVHRIAETGQGAAATAPVDVVESKRLPAAVWVYAAIAFLNAVGTLGVNAYASLFSVRALGFSTQLAGFIVGVLGLLGVLSRVGWGRVNGAWGRPAPLISIMNLGGILALGLLSLAALTGQGWMLWVGVAIHAAFPLAANVVINSGLVEVTPRARIGTATGIVAGSMYLGFALGPALVGLIIDATHEFDIAWLAVDTTYVLCFVLALVLARMQRRARQQAA